MKFRENILSFPIRYLACRAPAEVPRSGAPKPVRSPQVPERRLD
ncbi:hypothetical protein [Oscillatoria sp. FACHB-1406]|nr:hypothetical protein [Oscillatoria sp. FACHB-1406]